jgi:hypothetical protein
MTAIRSGILLSAALLAIAGTGAAHAQPNFPAAALNALARIHIATTPTVSPRVRPGDVLIHRWQKSGSPPAVGGLSTSPQSPTASGPGD